MHLPSILNKHSKISNISISIFIAVAGRQLSQRHNVADISYYCCVLIAGAANSTLLIPVYLEVSTLLLLSLVHIMKRRMFENGVENN